MLEGHAARLGLDAPDHAGWPALVRAADAGDLEAVAAWGDTLKGATTRKIALFPRVDPATTPAADVAS